MSFPDISTYTRAFFGAVTTNQIVNLLNPTSSNANGGQLSRINFYGVSSTQSPANPGLLGSIVGSHIGTGADNSSQISIINNGVTTLTSTSSLVTVNAPLNPLGGFNGTSNYVFSVSGAPIMVVTSNYVSVTQLLINGTTPTINATGALNVQIQGATVMNISSSALTVNIDTLFNFGILVRGNLTDAFVVTNSSSNPLFTLDTVNMHTTIFGATYLPDLTASSILQVDQNGLLFASNNISNAIINNITVSGQTTLLQALFIGSATIGNELLLIKNASNVTVADFTAAGITFGTSLTLPSLAMTGFAVNSVVSIGLPTTFSSSVTLSGVGNGALVVTSGVIGSTTTFANYTLTNPTITQLNLSGLTTSAVVQTSSSGVAVASNVLPSVSTPALIVGTGTSGSQLLMIQNQVGTALLTVNNVSGITLSTTTTLSGNVFTNFASSILQTNSNGQVFGSNTLSAISLAGGTTGFVVSNSSGLLSTTATVNFGVTFAGSLSVSGFQSGFVQSDSNGTFTSSSTFIATGLTGASFGTTSTSPSASVMSITTNTSTSSQTAIMLNLPGNYLNVGLQMVSGTNIASTTALVMSCGTGSGVRSGTLKYESGGFVFVNPTITVADSLGSSLILSNNTTNAVIGFDGALTFTSPTDFVFNGDNFTVRSTTSSIFAIDTVTPAISLNVTTTFTTLTQVGTSTTSLLGTLQTSGNIVQTGARSISTGTGGITINGTTTYADGTHTQYSSTNTSLTLVSNYTNTNGGGFKFEFATGTTPFNLQVVNSNILVGGNTSTPITISADIVSSAGLNLGTFDSPIGNLEVFTINNGGTPLTFNNLSVTSQLNVSAPGVGPVVAFTCYPDFSVTGTFGYYYTLGGIYAPFTNNTYGTFELFQDSNNLLYVHDFAGRQLLNINSNSPQIDLGSASYQVPVRIYGPLTLPNQTANAILVTGTGGLVTTTTSLPDLTFGNITQTAGSTLTTGGGVVTIKTPSSGVAYSLLAGLTTVETYNSTTSTRTLVGTTIVTDGSTPILTINTVTPLISIASDVIQGGGATFTTGTGLFTVSGGMTLIGALTQTTASPLTLLGAIQYGSTLTQSGSANNTFTGPIAFSNTLTQSGTSSVHFTGPITTAGVSSTTLSVSNQTTLNGALVVTNANNPVASLTSNNTTSGATNLLLAMSAAAVATQTAFGASFGTAFANVGLDLISTDTSIAATTAIKMQAGTGVGVATGTLTYNNTGFVHSAPIFAQGSSASTIVGAIIQNLNASSTVGSAIQLGYGLTGQNTAQITLGQTTGSPYLQLTTSTAGLPFTTTSTNSLGSSTLPWNGIYTTTLNASGNITQTGATTFSTGTGISTFNGNVIVAGSTFQVQDVSSNTFFGVDSTSLTATPVSITITNTSTTNASGLTVTGANSSTVSQAGVTVNMPSANLNYGLRLLSGNSLISQNGIYLQSGTGSSTSSGTIVMDNVYGLTLSGDVGNSVQILKTLTNNGGVGLRVSMPSGPTTYQTGIYVSFPTNLTNYGLILASGTGSLAQSAIQMQAGTGSGTVTGQITYTSVSNIFSFNSPIATSGLMTCVGLTTTDNIIQTGAFGLLTGTGLSRFNGTTIVGGLSGVSGNVLQVQTTGGIGVFVVDNASTSVAPVTITTLATSTSATALTINLASSAVAQQGIVISSTSNTANVGLTLVSGVGSSSTTAIVMSCGNGSASNSGSILFATDTFLFNRGITVTSGATSLNALAVAGNIVQSGGFGITSGSGNSSFAGVTFSGFLTQSGTNPVTILGALQLTNLTANSLLQINGTNNVVSSNVLPSAISYSNIIQTGNSTFTSGTGQVTLLGPTTIGVASTNSLLVQTGGGLTVFQVDTLSPAIYLGTSAQGSPVNIYGSITQNGATTWSTGTGAVSLNGATTFFSTLTQSGTGAVTILGSVRLSNLGANLILQTDGTSNVIASNTLSSAISFGNITQSGGSTFTSGTGLFTFLGPIIAASTTSSTTYMQVRTYTGATFFQLDNFTPTIYLGTSLTSANVFVYGPLQFSSTITQSTASAVTFSGLTTINNGFVVNGSFSQTTSAAFSTGTGAVSLNGPVTFNSTFAQSGTSAITLNGDVAMGGNISQSGLKTFSTGTGAVSLNGATTFFSTLTQSGTGAITLAGPLTTTSTATFSTSGSSTIIAINGASNNNFAINMTTSAPLYTDISTSGGSSGIRFPYQVVFGSAVSSTTAVIAKTSGAVTFFVIDTSTPSISLGTSSQAVTTNVYGGISNNGTYLNTGAATAGTVLTQMTLQNTTLSVLNNTGVGMNWVASNTAGSATQTGNLYYAYNGWNFAPPASSGIITCITLKNTQATSGAGTQLVYTGYTTSTQTATVAFDGTDMASSVPGSYTYYGPSSVSKFNVGNNYQTSSPVSIFKINTATGALYVGENTALYYVQIGTANASHTPYIWWTTATNGDTYLYMRDQTGVDDRGIDISKIRVNTLLQQSGTGITVSGNTLMTTSVASGFPILLTLSNTNSSSGGTNLNGLGMNIAWFDNTTAANCVIYGGGTSINFAMGGNCSSLVSTATVANLGRTDLPWGVVYTTNTTILMKTSTAVGLVISSTGTNTVSQTGITINFSATVNTTTGLSITHGPTTNNSIVLNSTTTLNSTTSIAMSGGNGTTLAVSTMTCNQNGFVFGAGNSQFTGRITLDTAAFTNKFTINNTGGVAVFNVDNSTAGIIQGGTTANQIATNIYGTLNVLTGTTGAVAGLSTVGGTTTSTSTSGITLGTNFVPSTITRGVFITQAVAGYANMIRYQGIIPRAITSGTGVVAATLIFPAAATNALARAITITWSIQMNVANQSVSTSTKVTTLFQHSNNTITVSTIAVPTFYSIGAGPALTAATVAGGSVNTITFSVTTSTAGTAAFTYLVYDVVVTDSTP